MQAIPIVLLSLICNTICKPNLLHRFDTTLLFLSGPGQLEKLKYRFKRETTVNFHV